MPGTSLAVRLDRYTYQSYFHFSVLTHGRYTVRMKKTNFNSLPYSYISNSTTIDTATFNTLKVIILWMGNDNLFKNGLGDEGMIYNLSTLSM